MSCGQSQINCYNPMKTFVQQSICTTLSIVVLSPKTPSQGFCRFDMTLTLASAWRKKGMFAWLFRKRKEPLRPIVDYCKGCCMLLLLLSHSPIDRTNEALPWSLTVRIASIEHTTSTLAALKHTGNSYNFSPYNQAIRTKQNGVFEETASFEEFKASKLVQCYGTIVTK